MAGIVHLTSVHRALDHRIFYKECRTLAQAGFKVTLIAPAEFDEQMLDGVRILGISPPRSRWGRPGAWWRLFQIVRQQKPDLVHVHDPELLLIVPLLRLALGNRVRLVYDVHEYFVESIAQKVWIPAPIRAPAGRMAGALERILGRGVDGLILVVEEQLPFYHGWKAERAIVHNYPELAAFADATPLDAFPASRFRLIHIGSLHERRGIMTMLEALAEVVPNAPETLLILGGTFESDQFRFQVERFIAGQGLQENVALLGWIDHSMLKHYLASADVALLPDWRGSQYRRRHISTKQLECMLMGLPLVSSDHPHLRTLVEGARCGLTAEAGNSRAYAEAILWLYRNPDARLEMGKRGSEVVASHYSWEGESRTLVELYDQLLGAPEEE